jgi:hypothetical protein
MLKSTSPTLHKTTRTEIIPPLFSSDKLRLDETPKAISPFGGLASFISFLGQNGFAKQVQSHLPFAEPTSNNAIPLAHCLTAFLMSVIVGARRFAHTAWLRADEVLHALLGLPRFPSDDMIRSFFLRFTQADIEKFWQPLCTFNLLSLYQHQTTPRAAYRQPGTLRVGVFLCGAMLGVMGREAVLKLSAAWGGLGTHKPLVEATLNWLNDASPKLVPPEDRVAIGGCHV